MYSSIRCAKAGDKAVDMFIWHSISHFQKLSKFQINRRTDQIALFILDRVRGVAKKFLEGGSKSSEMSATMIGQRNIWVK